MLAYALAWTALKRGVDLCMYAVCVTILTRVSSLPVCLSVCLSVTGGMQGHALALSGSGLKQRAA